MKAGLIPLDDVTLFDLEGRRVNLREIAAHGFLLIIFLRHLA